jgi:hypothetical protein
MNSKTIDLTHKIETELWWFHEARIQKDLKEMNRHKCCQEELSQEYRLMHEIVLLQMSIVDGLERLAHEKAEEYYINGLAISYIGTCVNGLPSDVGTHYLVSLEKIFLSFGLKYPKIQTYCDQWTAEIAGEIFRREN